MAWSKFLAKKLKALRHSRAGRSPEMRSPGFPFSRE
jgi:hypothetical protein